MIDIVDSFTRSKMMAKIKSKNTKPEILVRSMLHQYGFRYRLHIKDLPGKPDIVLPKYKAIVFVHGCFWHGHTCQLFRLPSTNTEFWSNKIQYNRRRDSQVKLALLESGWRVATIWECALRGKGKDLELCFQELVNWIPGNLPEIEIK